MPSAGDESPRRASPQPGDCHLPSQLPSQLPPEVLAPSEPDEVFDRYARLVTSTLGVPVGLVSLVSTAGQVFPGAVGLPDPWQRTRCTGLSHSFCQHVVAHDAPLVITDAREDPRLADNLAIDDLGVIAYAGFPLHDADGTPVGSLCAIDTQPRQWSSHELDVLADLAATASSELVLRRTVTEAAASRDAELEALAQVSAIAESMVVGYAVLDAGWRITYLNPEARRILAPAQAQLAGADLVGQVHWEAFPTTVSTEYEEFYRRAVATGQVVVFEAYYPAPLDAWFEVRATPQGEGLALYFVDVTERRDARAAAERASARVGALGRIALSLTDAETIEDLVVVMAEQGHAALGADGGAVAVPDSADPAVLLSYVTASYGHEAQTSYARLPLSTQLPVCQAARTRARVLVPDRAACLAYSLEMAEVVAVTGSAAFASVPLAAGGELVGVLTVGWDSPQAFEAEQVGLLETYAAQCAQALARLGARQAEHAAAERARRSAAQQSALVGIARALGDASSQQEVLEVLDAQGTALLGAAGSGLCLPAQGGTHVTILSTAGFEDDVRAQVQRVPVDFPMPVVHTAVTGTAHHLPDRAATVAAFPGAEELYTAAGVQASVSVPLRAATGLLGSLSMAFTEARTWGEPERELLEAFAAITAQALGRIAAHAAEQRALAAAAGIAETLQRSMLTAPPAPDHLEVAVRYAAAAEAAEVGGDWYDAFVTADGLTSVVIGDVTGHDMAAAAVMGQLRNLVRGIGFTLGQPPAAVLAAVDRAAAGLGIDTVATAILAQVEQDQAHLAAGTRLLRWSNAGHLPPLLIEADGAVRYLDAPSDLVLGWDPSVDRHDHEHVLAPGSTVLLYTDGLIERRGVSLDRGLAWLAGAVAGLAGGSTEELCSGLVELVGDHLDDDVALLALRAHPQDAPRPAQAGSARVPEGLAAAQRAAGTSSR